MTFSIKVRERWLGKKTIKLSDRSLNLIHQGDLWPLIAGPLPKGQPHVLPTARVESGATARHWCPCWRWETLTGKGGSDWQRFSQTRNTSWAPQHTNQKQFLNSTTYRPGTVPKLVHLILYQKHCVGGKDIIMAPLAIHLHFAQCN